MDTIWSQLEAYINFKHKIKESQKSKNQKRTCYFAPKEDILNWKQLCNYDTFLKSKEEWQSYFIKTNIDYNFNIKFFTDFKVVKENLKNGISIINDEFIKSTGNEKQLENLKEIVYNKGNNKIIFELIDQQKNKHLLCKLSKENMAYYITFEFIKSPLLIIKEIINSKDDELINKNFSFGKTKLNMNIFPVSKKQSENYGKKEAKIHNNIPNNNTSEIIEDKNKNGNNIKNNIPDFIYEALILLYKQKN